MNDSTNAAAVIADFDRFSAQCEETNYTDTGVAWDLMNRMADVIRERLPLLEERKGGAYYLGNLEQGKALLRAGLFGHQQIVARKHEGGAVSMELHDGPIGQDQGTLRSWGTSGSGDMDEAWRWLLGSEFGPLDEEYDEAHLRKVLSEVSS